MQNAAKVARIRSNVFHFSICILPRDSKAADAFVIQFKQTLVNPPT